MPSTIERAAEHLGRAAAALEAITGSTRAATQLLALLGWAPPPGVNDISLAQLNVSAVVARIDDLAELHGQEHASDADLALAVIAVVGAVADAFDDIEQVVGAFQATPDYLSATGIRDQLFDRIANLLVIHAIGSVVPAAIPVGALLGLLEFTHLPADPAIFQVEHVRQVVRWDRLSTLFTDPTDLLRQVYGWGTPAFRGNALVTNIGRVVEFMSADARLRPLPREAEEQISGRPVPEAETDPAAQLLVSLDKGLGLAAFDVGLTVYALRASTPGGTDGGIGVSPYVFGTAETTFPLSDRLSLVLSGSTAWQSGLALLLRAGQDPQFLTHLLDTADTPGEPAAAFTLALRHAAADGGRSTLFAAPGVVFDAAAVTAGLGIAAGAELDPAIQFAVEDGRIHVEASEADGFLASILPDDGITATVDLDASWSHRDGLQIKGGAGLSTEIAFHKQAGPLRIDSLALAVKAGPDGVTGTVGVSGAASIGPVTASVAGMGAAVALTFARGNLGPVDLGARFRPPTGIGLSVDAKGVLTGGGFLFRDEAQQLYAGVMQLSLREQITLKAFGLIATRLPDGSRGYSLIVFITAEDFRPVPLGLGFTLLGIGGMIGVHRTFDQDVLRQGLKTGTLATLLFPRDPVGNAGSLIRTLSSAFPARRGSYLLGLLVKIGWFTPTLVLMDLALILEFGSRRRLLALGRISALLPSADNDLVRLNLEAMGVIDFDAGTAAIDAVLVDSRLAHKFPITGSAALRASVGARPGFVLSAGGLNPRFAPPANLPALDRVAIALSSGNNPRLICEAYFAITSNTVQFGARAALHASAAGFSVDGEVGFDVLVQLAPLRFIADFQARLQLKRGSRNLFMVGLRGSLEGPRPLRVTGKATFEILWCDFSVRFDTTLVRGEKPPLPPAVDLLAQLTQALASQSSWSTERDATRAHGVALRSLPPASATAPIVLDPLGQLLVTQQVVPLNTARDIDTFGGAPVAGARRFAVTAALNGTPLPSSARTASFAPAQFFTMSDDEKLAAPSFESMDAGYVFGAAGATFDPAGAIPAPVDYKEIRITLAGTPPAVPDTAAPPPYTLSPAQLQLFTRSGAAARAPVRRVGRARFRHEAVEGAAAFSAKRWAIVPLGEWPAVTVDPAVRTWSEHQAVLTTANRAGARWQLVPVYELED